MKLHGFPLSNYYNMVKHAVPRKRFACEFVETRPSQDATFLLKSPMGKVPLLETEQGFLTETNVILDYLEGAILQSRCCPTDVSREPRSPVDEDAGVVCRNTSPQLSGQFFSAKFGTCESWKSGKCT